jgi:hypothetical protein
VQHRRHAGARRITLHERAGEIQQLQHRSCR